MRDRWWTLSDRTWTLYGFGTFEEARKYCQHLNRGREVNLFSPTLVDGRTKLWRALEQNQYPGQQLELSEALAEARAEQDDAAV